MSRIVEVEVQTTINNIQIIDKTVNILSNSGKTILEFYELIQQNKGDVHSDKTFNKDRHEKNKNLVLKNLRKL